MRKPSSKVLALILIVLLNQTLLQRLDQVSFIPKTAIAGTQGTWLTPLYCPEGSLIQSYRQFVDYTSPGLLKDPEGLVSVEFTCVDYVTSCSTVLTPSGIKSDSAYNWGSLRTCAQTSPKSFMKGFFLKYGDSSIAATLIKMRCLDNVILESTVSVDPGGGWIAMQECPMFTAMCGFQIKYDSRSSVLDNVGLSDIKFFCCPICDFDYRYFEVITNSCAPCHYTCKGCSGFYNKCSACYFGISLSSSKSCDYSGVLIDQSLTGSPPTQDGWIFGTTPATTLTSSCGYLGYMLGGVNILGETNSLQKTFNLIPYADIRILLRFIKIDSWNSDSLFIDLNTLRVFSKTYNIRDSAFYGDVCAGTAGMESEEIIEIFKQSKDLNFENTITIKLSASLSKPLSDGSWGISSVYTYTTPCDLSCKTCDNGSTCLTCYDNASIGLYGQCNCNRGYYMLILNPCTQPPCNQCLTACPTSHFPVNSPGRCYACAPVCLTCNDYVTNGCLSCVSSKFYASYTKECVSACESTDYIVGNNCYRTCPSGTRPNTSTKTCEAACNIGQFLDADDVCKSCDPTCLTCRDFGTFNCLSCASPLFLKDYNCLSSCPSPLFGLTTTNSCVSLCTSPYFGNEATRMCVASCPTAQYGESGFRICRDCSSNCVECSSSSVCTTCKTNFYLQANACVSSCISPYWADTNSKTCATSCPAGLTGDPADRVCKTLVCHSSCLTCNGFSSTDCLTCASPNFWDSTQKTCAPLCLAGYYGDTNDRVCKTCGAECSACESASVCTSCQPGFFFVQTLKSCVTSCPTGYFEDLTSRACIKNCHASCLTCRGSTKNDCLTCSSPNYLDSNTCVAACPKAKFARDSDRTCQPCEVNCATCRAPGNICETCIEQRFKNADACVQVCPAPTWGSTSEAVWKCESDCSRGFYQNIANRTCLRCNSTCQTCNGGLDTNCLSCSSGAFLEVNSKCSPCDTSCKECLGKANNCTSCPEQYKLYADSPSMNSCLRLNCNIFCAKCVGDNKCDACINTNYYLEALSVSEKVCKEKVKVDCSFTALSNPKMFQLKFSNSWPEVFQTLANKTLISISNLDASLYNCSLSGDAQNGNTIFSIGCWYKSNVTASSSISVKITNYPPNTENSSHYLLRDSFELGLSSYTFCGDGVAWKEATQSCFTPSRVTPYIRLTSDPQIIIYGFDSEVPEELDASIGNNTFITIPSLNSSLYSAKIGSSPDLPRYSYRITLTYKGAIKNNPKLIVILALSPGLRSNDSLVFTKQEVQIDVMDYYFLEEETQKAVESSASVAKSSSSTADQAFIGSNLISPGSTFMIKSLVINQIIHLMRFVKINYPPNIMAIFTSQLGKASLVPEFELKEDLEDGIPEGKYYQHKISAYVLNNCGSFLLTCYSFLLIGILLRLAGVVFKEFILRKRVVLALFGFLYDFFVWNFPISFFLAKYQTISLLIGVALRFPTRITVKGIMNFFFALTSSIVVIIVPFLSVLIVYRMRNYARLLSIIKPFTDVSQPRGTFQAKSQKEPKFSLLAVEDISSNKKPEANVTNESGSASPKTVSGNGTPGVFNEEENANFRKDVMLTSNMRDSALETETALENPQKGKENKSKPGVSHFSVPGESAVSTPSKDPQGNFTLVKKETKKKLSFLDPKKNLLIPESTQQDTSTSSRPSKIVTKGMRWGNFVDKIKKKSLEFKSSTLSVLKEGKRKFSSFFRPSQPGSISNYLDKMKRSFKVFHHEYKIASASTHYFMVFEILRQLVITSIIIGLEEWPLSQTILITLTNLVFFIASIILRPYVNLIILVQSLTTELMLITACLGFLTLAILDKTENKDFDLRMSIGWWVSYTNISIILFMLLMFALQVLLLIGKLAITLKRKLKKNNRVGE